MGWRRWHGLQTLNHKDDRRECRVAPSILTVCERLRTMSATEAGRLPHWF